LLVGGVPIRGQNPHIGLAQSPLTAVRAAQDVDVVFPLPGKDPGCDHLVLMKGFFADWAKTGLELGFGSFGVTSVAVYAAVDFHDFVCGGGGIDH
jgi:hypothetical protein